MLNSKLSLRKIKKIVFVLVLLILVGLAGVNWVYVKDITRENKYIGEYYMGDGYFTCSLSIKSNQTYSLRWAQDTMNVKEYHGTYVIGDNFVELQTKENPISDSGCLAQRFTLIYWQGREYLFFGDARLTYLRDQFCQNIRDNKELDREKSGSFYPYINVMDKERIDIFENTSDRPINLDGSPFCQE